MSLPDATLSITDGALGLIAESSTGVQVKIGNSSIGTANAVMSIGTLDLLTETYGTGPLVEAAARVLAVAGGPVICIKTPNSTPGEASAVVQDGDGDGIVTVAGAALDAYTVSVEITAAADVLEDATGAFRYTLDDGLTWSAEIALPIAGTYELPATGLTLTFADAVDDVTLNWVVGDLYEFTATGPMSTLEEISTAVQAAADADLDFEFIHVVGPAEDIEGTAAAFAAFDILIASMETNYRFVHLIMECADDTDANILSAFNALSSSRISVGAGLANISSPLSGRVFKRNAAWVQSERTSQVVVSEDCAWVGRGAVRGVVSLDRDERRTPGLDAGRLSTLRTHIGLPGFYITNARMASAPTSDFRYAQHRRVMDLACKTVRAAQLPYLSQSVRVDKVTGLIDERDALAIEARIEGQLRAAVTQPGYASDVSVLVDRSVNILSTETLVVKYRVLPLGYLKHIEGEIGFTNPALAAA